MIQLGAIRRVGMNRDHDSAPPSGETTEALKGGFGEQRATDANLAEVFENA